MRTVETTGPSEGPRLSSSRSRELETENERLRRAVDELSVLNDLARRIGASRNLDEVLHAIVSRSIKAVHAEEGVITLVNRDGDAAHTLVREFRSCADVDAFHMRGAVLGWMMNYESSLLVSDPANDDRFRGVEWEPGVSSLLAVPLVVNGRLTGVLAAYNKQGSSTFDASDQRLLTIIASQSAQVIENARLVVEEIELERMNEQVRLAADVQLHLLPDTIPEIEGYDVGGTSVAADVVGGDYYDVVPLDDGRFAICLGDVSGKGLPASLLMANVQSMIRLMCSLGFSSCQMMQNANDLLCRCTSTNRFVTFFLAILDPRTGELEFCNAGHNPPLIVSAVGEFERLTTKGAVLGMIPKFSYQCGTRAVAPGDLLVIFSDGVTEALSPADDEFGEERLVDLLQHLGTEGAEIVLRDVLDAIRQHASGRKQSDDITILALRRTSVTSSASVEGR